MRMVRQQDRIQLSVNLLEAQILERVLTLIIANYQLKPAEIDPRVASVWYSTRGCETAKMEPDETKDWIETLHGFRSAHIARLQEWVKTLGTRKTPVTTIDFTFKEATDLVTILNDHRLFLAAKYDIGQPEMDLRSIETIHQLTPIQQNAVCEIHFLAVMIEQLLRFAAPEASSWMDSLADDEDGDQTT